MSEKLKVTLTPQVPHSEPPDPPELPDDVVVDARGRKLKLSEPDVLQESRLVKAMGDAAMNAAYMATYVMSAAMVVEIDGEKLPFPMNQLQVDAAITRMGRDGLSAVMTHLTKKHQKQEELKDSVKNS